MYLPQVSLFSIILIFNLLMACGVRKDVQTGASVEMANESSMNLLSSPIFSEVVNFAFSPIAIQMNSSEDESFMVWGAESCPGLKGSKDVDGQKFDFYDAAHCYSATSNESLDLNTDNRSLNESLRSQSWPIPPGEYTGITFKMCHRSEASDDLASSNISYQTQEMQEIYTTKSCHEIYAPFTESFQVISGKRFIIRINYSLDKLVQYVPYEGNAESFAELDKEKSCFYREDAAGYYCPLTEGEVFSPEVVY